MYYFVPAWYGQGRIWYDTTSFWFRVFERMQFDDTVNHIKMFEHVHEPTQLLILNYSPQLRYYLHKQGLLTSSYWSFFDDIQNIKSMHTNPISFKELDWPQGTAFHHSPFALVAMLEEAPLAYIHFAENGNLMQIDYQKDGHTDKTYVFDDRGFLSSLIYYDANGQAQYQDYLNPKGVWQVREVFGEQSEIIINPVSDHMFRQMTYDSWEALIIERLSLLSRQYFNDDDTLVIASHEQHNHLLLSLFEKQTKVLSFFGARYNLASSTFLEVASAADLMVTDTKTTLSHLKRRLEEVGLSDKKVTQISPFDTRLRLGHSQFMKELIIYFYIDTISDETLREYMLPILDKMALCESVQLRLITFRSDYDLKNLQSWVEQLINERYERCLFYGEAEGFSENHVDEEVEELQRISFEYFSNENHIIEALDSARLVIDLGEVPDLYTQIASISAGVPQINRVETDYVDHQKNGWLISSQQEMLEALDHYFDGLTNWNKALVYAVSKMSDYTSGKILAQWQALLEKE
ncbi:accessory Sec system protein Asp1 [Lactococcus ileimucosae]|uniref:Accessory Sec system protein Asp1 n=1 Tax=Lactococcus ileimucosae TaxID=2941329 RepID=A0ABV4D7A3_9LACT